VYPDDDFFEVKFIGFDPFPQEGGHFREVIAFGCDQIEVVVG
jgi:hypothetical protein